MLVIIDGRLRLSRQHREKNCRDKNERVRRHCGILHSPGLPHEASIVGTSKFEIEKRLIQARFSLLQSTRSSLMSIRAILPYSRARSDHYSDLNAWTGSIDAARRAGMIPATQAAIVTVAIAPNKTFGSALLIS
jgi:hypothetical protein